MCPPIPEPNPSLGPHLLAAGRTGESEVAQSGPTLCDPMDCSLPGFSIHGIFQARVPEWVAISSPGHLPRPRDQTQVSHIVGRCFTLLATREALGVLAAQLISPSALAFSQRESLYPRSCFLLWGIPDQ